MIAEGARVKRERLEEALRRFEGDADARHVVARQARDLAASGALETDLGVVLDTETVVEELADAPAEYTLVERWNWWMGSLELSQRGYEEFRVRRY